MYICVLDYTITIYMIFVISNITYIKEKVQDNRWILYVNPTSETSQCRTSRARCAHWHILSVAFDNFFVKILPILWRWDEERNTYCCVLWTIVSTCEIFRHRVASCKLIVLGNRYYKCFYREYGRRNWLTWVVVRWGKNPVPPSWPRR